MNGPSTFTLLTWVWHGMALGVIWAFEVIVGWSIEVSFGEEFGLWV